MTAAHAAFRPVSAAPPSLLAVLLLLGWAPAGFAQSGNTWRELEVGGRARRYLLHAPGGLEPGRRRPLVILFHGHGGTARQALRMSRLDELADRAGFLVAAPEGTGWRGLPPRGWNAISCCGYAMRRQVDDTAFIRALLDDLESAGWVDPARVYATGISNGGMLAHRLGCELSDRLAAIAPVAGALTGESCHPDEPVSVLIIHGTADRYVPYDGGVSPLNPAAEPTARGRGAKRRVDRSADSAAAFWAEHNRCRAQPERVEDGLVVRHRYVGGAAGAEVVSYTVRGGGHAWPGGRRGWRFADAPSPALDATALMWEFFRRHPKR